MYFDFTVSWYISLKLSFNFRCGLLSSKFVEWNNQIPTKLCWQNKVVYKVFVRSCRCCIVKTSRSLWHTNRFEVEQSHLKLRAEKSGHSIPGSVLCNGEQRPLCTQAKSPFGWNYTWLTLQVGINILGYTFMATAVLSYDGTDGNKI